MKMLSTTQKRRGGSLVSLLTVSILAMPLAANARIYDKDANVPSAENAAQGNFRKRTTTTVRHLEKGTINKNGSEIIGPTVNIVSNNNRPPRYSRHLKKEKANMDTDGSTKAKANKKKASEATGPSQHSTGNGGSASWLANVKLGAAKPYVPAGKSSKSKAKNILWSKETNSPPSPTSPSSPSAPRPTSKTDKGGKSRKVSSGICTKRLRRAYTLLSYFEDGDGPFGPIRRPSDVTDLCHFEPPATESESNFGCPFIYYPPMGFIKGEEQYVDIFGEKVGEAFQALAMYCECYQGYELGCAAKIPHGPPTTMQEYPERTPSEVIVPSYSEYIPVSTPGERTEYCKLVGVWNGDFDTDIVPELEEDVVDCGCYFIGQAQDMVDQCPGVDLGAFFDTEESPSTPTFAPSSSYPTYSPTVFPTFAPTGSFAPTG